MNTPQETFSKTHPEFITITCLNWNPVLAEDRIKEIITSSMAFLSQSKRATIYAFVIMHNHFHMIWQTVGDHRREDVQRDFLRYTSQQILKVLRNENSTMQEKLIVNAKDRKRQVWERNSLGVELWTSEVLWQKLDYIHSNPVKAGLCKYDVDYKFSSAGFYNRGDIDWDFLVHIDG